MLSGYKIISKLDKGAEIGVIDIKSAFRLLRVYPGDFDLLGIKIDEESYISTCLPMGCSISCKLFNQFSTFLHWLVEKKCGWSKFIGPLPRQFHEVIKCFLNICKELGVPIADEKRCLTFLGFEIDTVEMMVRIPQEKLKILN